MKPVISGMHCLAWWETIPAVVALGVSGTSGTRATSHNLAEWDDGAYIATTDTSPPRTAQRWRSRSQQARGPSGSSTALTAWRARRYRSRSAAKQHRAGLERLDVGRNQRLPSRSARAAPVTRSVLIPNPNTDVFAARFHRNERQTTYQSASVCVSSILRRADGHDHQHRRRHPV